jgi:hypothetical protein
VISVARTPSPAADIIGRARRVQPLASGVSGQPPGYPYMRPTVPRMAASEPSAKATAGESGRGETAVDGKKVPGNHRRRLCGERQRWSDNLFRQAPTPDRRAFEYPVARGVVGRVSSASQRSVEDRGGQRVDPHSAADPLDGEASGHLCNCTLALQIGGRPGVAGE